MVPSSVTLSLKVPFICRRFSFSHGPTSLFSLQARSLTNSIQIKGIDSYSSHHPCSNHLNNFGMKFKDMDRRQMQLGSLAFSKFQISATSGSGGSGTRNGGFGGSGDGNYGGNNEGDSGKGGNNWSLLSWYLALLAKHPVVVKAVTSALLNLFGDLICQLFIEEGSSLDLKRTFLFTLLGLVLVGPTLHFWYLYLSKLVTMPGASGAFLRLLLDQLIFAPAFIGVFLTSLVTLEGRPSQVIPKLEQEWFSSVLANWKLWIPFQFLNFRFVPQQFQVLAANVIALVWNVILSFKAHKEILSR